MRKSYPSDMTREEFEEAKKKTHPRKYELYDIFCAILYMLKEDCSWRDIPHDYPNWQNVRYHYDIWSKPNDNGISLFLFWHHNFAEDKAKILAILYVLQGFGALSSAKLAKNTCAKRY